jgi:hypothetical protein
MFFLMDGRILLIIEVAREELESRKII